MSPSAPGAAPGQPSPRWIIRLLAAACVLLAAFCVALAAAWSRKAEEAACFREAVAAGEVPAIADSDCLRRSPSAGGPDRPSRTRRRTEHRLRGEVIVVRRVDRTRPAAPPAHEGRRQRQTPS